MATPVTIRQRVELQPDGRTLRVRTQQGNQARYSDIELPRTVKNSRQVNITEVVSQWPKTELKLDTELTANLKESE